MAERAVIVEAHRMSEAARLVTEKAASSPTRVVPARKLRTT
jgi:hypothetical protein